MINSVPKVNGKSALPTLSVTAILLYSLAHVCHSGNAGEGNSCGPLAVEDGCGPFDVVPGNVLNMLRRV